MSWWNLSKSLKGGGGLICHINYWAKSIPGKIYRNSGMVQFVEVNQATSSYSMLQDTTPKRSNTKACAKELSQILANSIDNWGERDWSEFMWSIVGSKLIKLELNKVTWVVTFVQKWNLTVLPTIRHGRAAFLVE